MTARTNSRVAGFFFLFYIANGIADLIVENRARAGATPETMLSAIAQHEGLFRLATLLTLLTTVDALALAVAIWGLTRRHDPELAVLALAFRVGEGIVAAVAAVNETRVLALVGGDHSAVANQVAASILRGSSGLIGGFLFSVGSAIYCYIFLRARNIPHWLAWLGFLSSLLLVAGLPLQLVDLLHAPLTSILWIPMALFEVIFGVWLLVKGVVE